MIEIVHEGGEPRKPSQTVMMIRSSGVKIVEQSTSEKSVLKSSERSSEPSVIVKKGSSSDVVAKQERMKVVVPEVANKPVVIMEGTRIGHVIVKPVTQLPIVNYRAIPWNYERVTVTYKGKEIKEEICETQGLTRSGRCFSLEELRKAKISKDNLVLVKKAVTKEEVEEFLRKMKPVSLPENLGTFGLGFKLTAANIRRARMLKQRAWVLPKPVPRLSRSFEKSGTRKRPATTIPSPVIDLDKELIERFEKLFNGVNMVEISEGKPKPNLNDTKAINLGDADNIRETKISVHLEPKIREEMIKALIEYKDIFAWSYDDMPGLSSDLVVHKLPTDPTFPPVKQKLRKFKNDMSMNIKKEITKKLDAKVIRVTRYPVWLANVVPVPKKDGKIRGIIRFLWMKKMRKRRYSSRHGELIVTEVLHRLCESNRNESPSIGRSFGREPLDEEYEPLRTYFPDEEVMHIDELEQTEKPGWKLFFDRAANMKGVGIGAVLISEIGHHYPVTTQLRFYCTNNMDEYEECILVLSLAADMDVQEVLVLEDSDLLVHGDLIYSPPSELHTMSAPWPFVAWGMDVIGPIEPAASNGHRFILVAIDYFTNNLMKAVCQQFKITHRNSTPYCPKKNGAVEAANKNIKKILRKMVEGSRKWHEKLPFTLLGYRTTVRTSVGATPYLLVYGTKPVIPVEVEIPSLRIVAEAVIEDDEWVKTRLEQLSLIDKKRLAVVCHGLIYQKRMARAYNKKVCPQKF
ncbi:uncharacterized protein [Nicotiana sylvestris]|uniref:uncharacterized protein n=1 Tax=Nicotiana sylvestris TaxID=4096 RepID=UPI00388C9E60